MRHFFLLFCLSFLVNAVFAQANADSLFSSSEMTLKTPNGEIFGTLTVPTVNTPVPLVLIIAGSGPTDRDCNSSMGITTNAYRMLAEGLAKNGIACLRFDKRGIGQSKAAMTSELDLRFETYVNDVVAWIAVLKADKRFSEIDVLGHSEGSLIGMLAASQASVAKFISAAGAGKPADQILRDQLKTKLPPSLLAESNKILDSLKLGKTVSNVDANLKTLYRPNVQPYMISWMKYDPAREISLLKMPVLILQGTTDMQVSVEDARLLAAAKPDARLLIIDNMNHVFKESDSDFQKNMATYKNPALALKTGLLQEILSFIRTGK